MFEIVIVFLNRCCLQNLLKGLRLHVFAKDFPHALLEYKALPQTNPAVMFAQGLCLLATGGATEVVLPSRVNKLRDILEDSDDEGHEAEREAEEAQWRTVQQEGLTLIRKALATDPNRKHFLTIEKFFFEFAVATSPNDPAGFLNMALVCQHLRGSYFEADRWYRRSLDGNPCAKPALRNYLDFLRGRMPGGPYRPRAPADFILARGIPADPRQYPVRSGLASGMLVLDDDHDGEGVGERRSSSPVNLKRANEGWRFMRDPVSTDDMYGQYWVHVRTGQAFWERPDWELKSRWSSVMAKRKEYQATARQAMKVEEDMNRQHRLALLSSQTQRGVVEMTKLKFDVDVNGIVMTDQPASVIGSSRSIDKRDSDVVAKDRPMLRTLGRSKLSSSISQSVSVEVGGGDVESVHSGVGSEKSSVKSGGGDGGSVVSHAVTVTTTATVNSTGTTTTVKVNDGDSEGLGNQMSKVESGFNRIVEEPEPSGEVVDDGIEEDAAVRTTSVTTTTTNTMPVTSAFSHLPKATPIPNMASQRKPKQRTSTATTQQQQQTQQGRAVSPIRGTPSPNVAKSFRPVQYKRS